MTTKTYTLVEYDHTTEPTIATGREEGPFFSLYDVAIEQHERSQEVATPSRVWAIVDSDGCEVDLYDVQTALIEGR